MNDEKSFLKALLKQIGQPFERKCRHCAEMHEAQSYSIHHHKPEDDEEPVEEGFESSIMIDFGRCSAMTNPNQCFRVWVQASEFGREKMRQMAQDLSGNLK